MAATTLRVTPRPARAATGCDRGRQWRAVGGVIGLLAVLAAAPQRPS